MKKVFLLGALLSIFATTENILSMELAKPAAAVPVEQSVPVAITVHDLQQLSAIHPHSHNFAGIMEQLEAAKNNFDNNDGLMVWYIKATILLNNKQLQSPEHSLLMVRVSQARNTLYQRLLQNYTNEAAAGQAIETFTRRIPGLPQQMASGRDVALATPQNHVFNIRREEDHHHAHPVQILNILRENQRSTWSSNFLSQLALLCVVFRLLGADHSTIVQHVTKMIGWNVTWKDGVWTGNYGFFFVRAVLQLVLFSGGQAILSRHDSNPKRVLQTSLPFIISALAWKATNFDKLYMAMYRITDFLGLSGVGGCVKAYDYQDLAAAMGMLATISGATIYDNYDSIKKLLALKRNNPDHQS